MPVSLGSIPTSRASARPTGEFGLAAEAGRALRRHGDACRNAMALRAHWIGALTPGFIAPLAGWFDLVAATTRHAGGAVRKRA